jgi:hypothetical protein
MRAGRRAWRELQRERDLARAAAAKARLWRSVDVRFLTLTQQDEAAETAKEALARLTRSLALFIRRKEWRRHVAGAVIHIEIERSTPETRRARARRSLDDAEVLETAGLADLAKKERDSGHALLRREQKISLLPPAARSWWHAHAHVACASGWWPVDEINRSWSAAAFKAQKVRWGVVGVDGVDVVVGSRSRKRVRADMRRPARGVLAVVDELTKYITKPVSLAKLTVAEVGDLLDAINGRRLLRCTGALRGVVLEEQRAQEEDKEGWTGDGETKPLGLVADETSALGARGVYLSDVDPATGDVIAGRLVAEWRDDAEAQEFRRAAAERTWDLHRSGRVRGTVDDLPAT